MRALKVLLPLFVFATVFATFGFAAQANRVAAQIDSSQTVSLAQGVHEKAQAQFDRGPVDGSFQITSMTLLTAPTAAQSKALAKLLADQQNPKSANYHKWITPEQYADRFGLSTSDIKSMTAWLKSQGFTVTAVARARNWIKFNGTAAQVQSAFQTEIHQYSVDNELHFANATAPRIPGAFSQVVTAVRGLHDFRLRPHIRRNGRLHPYYTDAQLGQLVAPGDIATIYGIKPLTGIDGTGIKIAVVGQTDVYLADLTDFRTGFGLSSISCTTNGSGVVTSCNDAHFKWVLAQGSGVPGVQSGDLGESDLDLEWAGAVAPGAQIVFDTSTNVIGSMYDVIDNNVAPIISMSYGLCERGEQGFFGSDEAELSQGNSQGITILNSTGDTGAAACDPNGSTVGNQGLSVSYPASSPEVTAVGGTLLPTPDSYTSTFWGPNNDADGGSALSYIPENAWNDDTEIAKFCSENSSSFCTGNHITDAQSAQAAIGMSATGGGASNCFTATSGVCNGGFARPVWQTVTVSGAPNVRLIPDVSLMASPNFPGYIFCTPLSELGGSGSTSSCATGITNAVENNFSIIGGTSASTPVFAGMVALLNQFLQGNSSTGLGNINPMLYSLADPANAAFNPVTTGTNKVYCNPGTPSSQPSSIKCPAAVSPATLGIYGYDAATADATTGFNLVTGLGSVNLFNLASAWQAASGQTFTFAPQSNSVSVVQGASATVTFDITPDATNGFNGTLNFSSSSCTGLPSEASCSFSPPSVTLTGTDPSTVTLTIHTTAPTANLQMPMKSSRIFYALLMPGLVGIFLTVGSRTRATRGLRILSFVLVLGLSTIWLSGCGGSNNSSNKDPGTPVGSYQVTVTATSGSVTKTAVVTVGVTAN